MRHVDTSDGGDGSPLPGAAGGTTASAAASSDPRRHSSSVGSSSYMSGSSVSSSCTSVSGPEDSVRCEKTRPRSSSLGEPIRAGRNPKKSGGCSDDENDADGQVVVVEAEKPKATPTPVGQLTILGIVLLSEAMSASSLFPYVGLYVGHLMGLSENKVGLFSGCVVAVFTLGQVVSATLWGFLSDRYGRKMPMMIGLGAGSVACFLFGLSPNFAFCCVLRFIHGCFNGNVLIAKTIIADITDSTNEAKGFSVMSLTWAGGVLIGSSIAGLLYDPRQQKWLRWAHIEDESFLTRYPAFLPNLFLSVYSFAAMLICFFWLKESNKKARSMFTILPGVVQLKLAQWFSCLLPYVDPALMGTHATDVTTIAVDADPIYPVMDQRSSEQQGEHLAKEEDEDHPGISFAQAFKDPLIRRVVIVVVAMGSSDTAFEEVLPLWCIATVSVGGLHLKSSAVAVIIGSYSVPTLLANFAFSRVCDFFGDQLFLFRFSAYGLTLLTAILPIGSAFGPGPGYWYVLVIGLLRQVVLSWTFGLMSMFTARCAPPGCVGALFGITQTASCFARCIVPAVVSITFSWSISESRPSRPFPFNHFFVFILCSVLTLGSAFVSYRINFAERALSAPGEVAELEDTGVDSPTVGDASHERREIVHSRRNGSRAASQRDGDGGADDDDDDGDADSVASGQSVLRDMMASSYAGAMSSLNGSFAQGAARAVEELHEQDEEERSRDGRSRRRRQEARNQRRHHRQLRRAIAAMSTEEDTRSRREEAEMAQLPV